LDALLAALTPQGMKVIGMIALDLFRIEGGFIIGGVEYDPTVSPYECGLGWSIDLEKGDFQGKNGLLRDREATSLRLTSVVLESGGDAASGAPSRGRPGGRSRHAGGQSPHLGMKTLGLAKIQGQRAARRDAGERRRRLVRADRPPPSTSQAREESRRG
jgi:glycine cleavage system aminomethyltransferase T